MAKRGPYGKNNGNKCSIEWHNHAPHECPGRARLKCEVCGRSLISHATFDYCDGNKDEPSHVLDELGMRRRLRDDS